MEEEQGVSESELVKRRFTITLFFRFCYVHAMRDLKPNTPSTLLVFIPSKSGRAQTVIRDVPHWDFDVIHGVQMEVNPEDVVYPFVGVYWYATDTDEYGYSSSTLKGFRYFSLCRSLYNSRGNAPPPRDVLVWSLVNLDEELCRRAAARIQCWHSTTDEFANTARLYYGSVCESVRESLSDAFDRYHTEIHTFLLDKCQNQSAVTQDNVSPWVTSAIPLPFVAGPIFAPMWAFCLPALVQPLVPSDTEFLIHMVRLALFRLCVSETALTSKGEARRLSTDVVREVACEAASLLALSLVYRCDRVGDKMCDEWTWLSVHPDLKSAGSDCEDSSQLTLHVLSAMQRVELTPQQCQSYPLMCVIQQEMREYEFCMCIGTLELEKGCVWHAYVMGFCRSWLSQRVDHAKVVQYRESNPAKLPFTNRPNLLIESTAYLTSCPAYKSHENERKIDCDKFPFQLDNPGTARKVGMGHILNDKQYKHTVIALTPQYAISKNVGEVYFFDANDGSLGYPTTQLFDSNQPLGLHMQTAAVVTPDVLRDVRQLLSWMPPLRAFPAVDESKLMHDPKLMTGRLNYMGVSLTDPEEREKSRKCMNQMAAEKGCDVLCLELPITNDITVDCFVLSACKKK